MGHDRIAAGRDRCIGFGQFDERNFRCAKRKAQILGQGRGDAQVARDFDDIVDTHLLRQAHRRDIAGGGERLAQSNAAAIFAAMIGGPIAAGGEGRVVHHVVGRHAGAKGGEVDEQLEG